MKLLKKVLTIRNLIKGLFVSISFFLIAKAIKGFVLNVWQIVSPELPYIGFLIAGTIISFIVICFIGYSSGEVFEWNNQDLQKLVLTKEKMKEQ